MNAHPGRAPAIRCMPTWFSRAQRHRELSAAAVIGLLCLAIGCAGDVSPVVEVAPLADTRDPLGPYTVTARVLEHRGLERVRLYYRADDASRAEIISMDELMDGRFEAAIPGQPAGTRIHWFVEAEDVDGNMGYAPLAAEWGDESCIDTLDPKAPVPEGGAAFCFSVLH